MGAKKGSRRDKRRVYLDGKDEVRGGGRGKARKNARLGLPAVLVLSALAAWWTVANYSGELNGVLSAGWRWAAGLLSLSGG